MTDEEFEDGYEEYDDDKQCEEDVSLMTQPAHGGLDFWNSVSKTDPNYTKQVKYGKREFTAIDAYYQIRNMTERFGPAGGEWHWNVPDWGVTGDYFYARVELYTPLGEHPIIQFGCAAMDQDGPKKAVTDGLTKCMSYLGFNSDVFLGEFDSNKYVQESAGVKMPAAKPAYSPPAAASYEPPSHDNVESGDDPPPSFVGKIAFVDVSEGTSFDSKGNPKPWKSYRIKDGNGMRSSTMDGENGELCRHAKENGIPVSLWYRPSKKDPKYTDLYKIVLAPSEPF